MAASVSTRLLAFLQRLEDRKIHYRLGYHRENYLMVEIAVPGERWEVEFTEGGPVEVEIFRSGDGVRDDETLLEELFNKHADRD